MGKHSGRSPIPRAVSFVTMGQYLATPIVDKEVLQGNKHGLQYGISAHQGWRKNMVRALQGLKGLPVA